MFWANLSFFQPRHVCFVSLVLHSVKLVWITMLNHIVSL